MSQMYELVLTAQGEVRDSEGNLISSEPVEARVIVTAEELAALDLTEEGGEQPWPLD